MYRCNNGVFYSLFPPFTRGNRCSPGKSMGFLRQNSKLDLNFRPVSDIIGNVKCRCDGMVDVTDSKSVGGDTVWVRVPPPAPIKRGHPFGCPLLIGAPSICFANRPPVAGFIEKQGRPGQSFPLQTFPSLRAIGNPAFSSIESKRKTACLASRLSWRFFAQISGRDSPGSSGGHPRPRWLRRW